MCARDSFSPSVNHEISDPQGISCHFQFLGCCIALFRALGEIPFLTRILRVGSVKANEGFLCLRFILIFSSSVQAIAALEMRLLQVQEDKAVWVSDLEASIKCQSNTACSCRKSR